MASVSGSRLSFFASQPVNLVLSTNPGATVAGSSNIEVFTTAAGSIDPGFQGSVFIQGASITGSNTLQAGGPASTEQVLQGSMTVVDQTGGEHIQLIGAGGGGDSVTVIASSGDVISGSTISGNSQLIDASDVQASVPGTIVSGPVTVTGGAGQTTVWAGAGDSITGGGGALTVAGSGASTNNNTIGGGSSALAAFDFGTGNSITGGSGTTFVNDAYGAGNGNTIVGGSGTGPITTPDNKGSDALFGGAGTWILGGTGDSIVAGSGTTFVEAGANNTITGAGATTVWGGGGGSIVGGAGGLQYNSNVSNASGDTVSGGTGTLFAYAFGSGESITGGSANAVINDAYTLVGGAFVGGNDTLAGGTGNATIFAGPGDTVNAGTGTFEIHLGSNVTGSETVDLSAQGAGGGSLRDDSVAGGAGTTATVTGFNTATDTIGSATSFTGGSFQGTSVVSGGNTIVTFVDGSVLTIVGVTTPITFMA